ncbi:SurA N-terminal domain-containing protein [Fodinibius sediminis]|uniref:Periplasmic chaperone PpiD n=1 Tax=Fodinibius sediminis TaxID=1214077 RepID=A0A521AH45_9BACT|nr:SurA N-terminal domain-containing protein [Fodinibius sediminis]SMO34126.1 peptidyl-prolyl cis-trans isomerase D [Fodinibius sediminis]
MGVMDKMRKSTSVILWVLIFSFGLLWMLADTNFFDVLQRGSRSLGAVNGETIDLEEYNNRINYYVEQYSQQTGNAVDAEMRANFEQRAWDEIVTGKLLQQKMEELGIEVTDQEVVNMITGENPDPFIRQQFQREDGTIDRVALKTAIESPENKQLWIAIEEQMRQKRRQQKMNNYLQSSLEVSQYEVEQQYIRNNTRADLSYVRFPYAEVSESDITVTEDDLRTYYENHQQQFERNETYRFNYVSFDKTPTRQDTARTLKEMEDLRTDFAEAENDSLFLNSYQSTTPYSVRTVEEDEVRELFAPVIELETGEVSEVIRDQGRVYLLKKVAESGSEVSFVPFSLDITADPIATVDKQAKEADDFSFFAEEDGFEAEAERRGLELKEGLATKGTNFISGIGQSQQIMNYLANAEEGEISEPLELSGQFVVLNVTEITPSGVQPFEQVKEQIRTTVTNEKRKEMTAARVQELLDQNSDLAALAEATGKQVGSAQSVSKNATTLPGAGREPSVVGAVFGLEQGEQSGPVKGTSAVFVVRVVNLDRADVSNMTQAQRSEIRQQLRQSKGAAFLNTWVEELREEAEIEDNRSDVLQG